MKKILSTLAAVSITAAAAAQGPSDALLFSQTNHAGTARTLAMGNAFVALGGDMGAIPLNPAASAIYRHSEVAVTPGLNLSAASSVVNGLPSNDYFSAFKLNNVGFVTSFDTFRQSGLVNITFGICVNRIADFNKLSCASWKTSTSSYPAVIAASLEGVKESDLEISDTHNPYLSSLPWQSILAYDSYLVSPYPSGVDDSYISATQNDVGGEYVIGGQLEQYSYNKTYGGIMETAINLGFNISDKFYIGCNLNVQSVDYSEMNYYSEKSVSASSFDDGFVSMSEDYYRRTTGSGINCKIGAIVTPVAGLRIGATFTTPTIYRLTDIWNFGMTSAFANGNRYSRYTPDGQSSYRVLAPLRWSVGAAYTFEQFGLISVDWEGINYSNLSMSDPSGNSAPFVNENIMISKGFRTASTLRTGLEIRPDNKWSIRGGYNWVSSPGSLVDKLGSVNYTYPDQHLASCGVGFRFGSERAASLDFAYQRILNYRERTIAYSDAPVIDTKHNANRFSLTFAFRF